LRARDIGLLIVSQAISSRKDTTMKLFIRLSRHTVSSQRKSIKLQIDHLEDRLVPSGFGPADGAYISEPWIGAYNDLQIQPTDQKIVAAGNQVNNSANLMAIARYDAQGNTDAGYGTGGVTTSFLGGTYTQGRGLTLQADGKAIVAGYLGSATTKHFLARLTTTGALDNSYGSGGVATFDSDPSRLTFEIVDSVALQSSGKAVLASYEQASSGAQGAVARFTTSGALDTGKNGFGTLVHGQAIGYTLSSFGTNTYFYDVAVQQDDKVVVVGAAPSSSGGFLVARYTANGALDTTFNGTGYTTLLPAGTTLARSYGITIQGDGKIVTVGACTGIDGGSDMLVSRFNTNGTLDTSFGGGKGYVQFDIDGTATQTVESGRDVVIQGDGKIVAAGYEYAGDGSVAMPASVLVARFNPDGTLDSTFGGGGFKLSAPLTGHTFGLQASVALESNGNIIVAGVDNDGTNNHPMLMRFFSTTTSPLGPVGNPGSPSNGNGLLFAGLAGTNAPGLISTGNKTPSLSVVHSRQLQHAQPEYRQSMAPSGTSTQAKALSLGAHQTPAQTADAAFLSLFPALRLHENLVVG
jgi:uncharacterized delta-60 repeat protein